MAGINKDIFSLLIKRSIQSCDRAIMQSCGSRFVLLSGFRRFIPQRAVVQ
jgi:hypothetical protein